MKSLMDDALKKMGDLNSAQLIIGTQFGVDAALDKSRFLQLAYDLWSSIWTAHYHLKYRKAVR